MAEKETKFVLTAADRASAVIKQVGANLKGLDERVLGLNAAFASFSAAVSVGALGIAAKSAIDAQDAIGKMAQKIGTSTESLSALGYSARLADVPLEVLQQSMKKLSVNMLEMQANSGEAKAAFNALGISVVNADGSLKTNQKTLFEIAEKFSKMEDGAGKTALAVKLFGRAGAEMIPLLNQGADGLKRNAEEAKKFGIIISTDAAKAAEEFNDNLIRLSEASRGFAISLANNVLPALNRFVQELLVMREATGSTMGAFFKSLTTDTHDPVASLNEITQKLEALKKTRLELMKPTLANTINDKLPWPLGGDIGDINKQISALEKQRDILTKIATLQGERDNFDPSLNRAPLGKAPRLPDEEALKRAAALLEKYRDKLRSLNDEIRKAEGVDSDLLKVKSLITSDKDFAAMSKAQKQSLLDAAELLDLQKAKARDAKELEEGLAQNAKELTAARTKELEDLLQLKQKYIELADPVQKFRKELEDVRRLEEGGFLTNDQATEAIFKINEQIDAVSGLNKEIKKGEDAAKDYAHAISTAFEDAIIGGKKAKDIASSLWDTLSRIVLRTTVTKPFEKFVESSLSDFSFTKFFQGLGASSTGTVPSYDTGTDYVPRTGLALVHQGERISRDSKAGGPTFYVDARGADVGAVARLERMVRQLNGTFEQRAVGAMVAARQSGIA